MKKILLTVAAASIAAGAWAVNYADKFPAAIDVKPNGEFFIDVTPKNYLFSESTLSEAEIKAALCPAGVYAENQPNLGNFWIQNNGEKAKDGILLFAGGFGMNGANPITANIEDMINNGMSILNLGDKIGNVLVFNGKNSDFGDYLYDNYSGEFNLDEDFSLKKMTLAQSAIAQFLWVPDPSLFDLKEDWDGAATTLRVRFEMSYYNPAAAVVPVATNISVTDETGTPVTHSNPINSDNFRRYTNNESTGDLGSAVAESWDPYRWAVCEYDWAGFNSTPSYVKMQIPGNAITNGALLIRNVKFYYCGHSVANQHAGQEITAPRVVYNDFRTLHYSTPGAIKLSHSQADDLHLSANEAHNLIVVAEKKSYDDVKVNEATYEVNATGNDNASVVLGTVANGKLNVSVAAAAAKSESPVEICVKAGDVTSNVVNLHHYAAPGEAKLVANETEAEKEMSFSIGADGAEPVEFKVNLAEGAYNFFNLAVDEEQEVATVAKNETEDGVVITPLAAGTMSFTVTPVLAGEHKTAATEFASEATTYTVNVKQGTDGVEVSVADGEGRVEYFNLQGVRVANPENGIYIRRQGNSSKVLKF